MCGLCGHSLNRISPSIRPYMASLGRRGCSRWNELLTKRPRRPSSIPTIASASQQGSTDRDKGEKSEDSYPIYLALGKYPERQNVGEDLSLDPAAWKLMQQARDTGACGCLGADPDVVRLEERTSAIACFNPCTPSAKQPPSNSAASCVWGSCASI